MCCQIYKIKEICEADCEYHYIYNLLVTLITANQHVVINRLKKLKYKIEFDNIFFYNEFDL